jgi:hypothetical protein
VNVSKIKEVMGTCAKYLREEKEKNKCLNRVMKHLRKKKLWLKETWKN